MVRLNNDLVTLCCEVLRGPDIRDDEASLGMDMEDPLGNDRLVKPSHITVNYKGVRADFYLRLVSCQRLRRGNMRSTIAKKDIRLTVDMVMANVDILTGVCKGTNRVFAWPDFRLGLGHCWCW